LDGNFIIAALKHKFDVKHRLEALLQDDVKLYVHRSTLEGLRSMGDIASDATLFAQTCCELISEVPLTNDPRLPVVQFLDNTIREGRRRYFVASQDDDLRDEVKRIPGCPTIYFNKVTLVLESPSSATQNFSAEVERRKLDVPRQEEEQLGSMMGKRPRDEETDESKNVAKRPHVDAAVIKKKRPALAPNPLSNKVAQKNSKSQEKKKVKKFRRSG
jgi:U3 small nucleolar RNA-associated protein 23